ncbi:SDR family oxidoreductase [Actinoplanes solisilvae]|uniref:SDR family oxidoreductase n=1 Tax=Actinoplanes solisilvae TaxID=2486853 RepID=UPI00196AF5B7|nr:SDR family oxidoreductase [Actinoplanes solisilvae]
MAVWFVTGASSGLGRAVVEILLARGDRVAATARNKDALAGLAGRYPDRVWTDSMDVTDTNAIRAVVARAFAEFSRIDVILSNAGRRAFGSAEDLSDEMISEQIALHMTGPMQLVRAVLPYLRKQGGGRIIQTTGMDAQIGLLGGTVYHASKWGAEGFFESLIPEVAPFGIGVTMVAPGNVRTGYGEATVIADPSEAYAATPVGRVGRYLLAHGGNLVASVQGDPVKVAAAIVDSATTDPAPRRIVLGSDAYLAIHATLTARLAELEEGRSSAIATDLTG